MFFSRRRFPLIPLVFILAVLACRLGGAPANPAPASTGTFPVDAPTPGPDLLEPTSAGVHPSTPTPEPVEALLWAAGASASSVVGGAPYHADQALDAPDTLACGDYVTAWQPAEAVTEATLELDYDRPILPEEIRVAQSYQPGQITRVEVLTEAGEKLTIYDAAVDPLPALYDCPVTNVFWTPNLETPITRVILTVARPATQDWTQIDAVGVLGWAQEDPNDPAPAGEPGPPEEGDPMGPTVFTDKHSVTGVAFSQNALWSASRGGLTAWALADMTPTVFTAADGLPHNHVTAVAVCPGQPDWVFAGGAGGLAQTFEGAPEFMALAHPGGEDLGPVTALACDPDQLHLWAAYDRHLSRYTIETGAWVEFPVDFGDAPPRLHDLDVIDGDVWFSTFSGVAVLRADGGFETFGADDAFSAAALTEGAARDSAGVIWMPTSDGLIAHDPASGDWTVFQDESHGQESLSHFLGGIAAVPGGEVLWLVDASGRLCRFDPSIQTCLLTTAPSGPVFGVSQIQVGPQGWVALGTLANGSYLYDGETWQQLVTADPVMGNTFHSVVYAPDGHLWLAGETILQHFPAARPSEEPLVFTLPEEGAPRVLHAARDGLWIGHTAGATFLPYLDTMNRLDLPLGGPGEAIAEEVTAITVDGAGRVYFGTTAGVSLWDGASFHYFVAPGPVNVLYADGTTVLAGGPNGLHKFESGEYRLSWLDTLSAISSDGTAVVNAMAPSPDGCGLLVGVGRDLMCFHGSGFYGLLTLPSDIRSILQVEHTLWLSTAADGLFTVPVDSTGVVWDLVSPGPDFGPSFGFQAMAQSDPWTVWFAALGEGGLLRMRGMWGQ